MIKLKIFIANFLKYFILAIVVAVLANLIYYRIITRQTKEYSFASSLYDAKIETSKLPNIFCWTNSLTSMRPDAFRCMLDDYIYDPCFLNNGGGFVVCPTNPYNSFKYFNASFDNTSDSILDNRYTPEQYMKKIHYPWYIKLYDGSECSFLTGATMLIGNMRMDYGCRDKDKSEFLLLPITESDSLSKVGCFKDNRVEQCSIKELWY